VAWGDADPFTPLDGPVGKFFANLASTRPETEFVLLEGVGHCPQDDNTHALHSRLLPWLTARWQQRSSTTRAAAVDEAAGAAATAAALAAVAASMRSSSSSSSGGGGEQRQPQ
jgi:hypothetical protein